MSKNVQNAGLNDRSGRPFGAQIYGDSDVFRNARARCWPDGSLTVQVCDRAVFRRPGFEETGPALDFWPVPPDPEDHMIDAERDGKQLSDGRLPDREAENRARAVRRAKVRLRTLCRANRFAYFITLTLSPEKVNRYDDQDILRRLSNWLRNASARFGLAYALVPERHKDGALHFHGLINDVLRVEDSGTIIPADGGRPVRPGSADDRAALLAAGGHPVFNLPQWGYGFTTAIRLYGDYDAAIGYVCKYIGKELDPATKSPARIGGRWVYSGGPLVCPEDHLFMVEDFSGFCADHPGFDFEVKETGDRWHVVEIPTPGSDPAPDQLTLFERG